MKRVSERMNSEGVDVSLRMMALMFYAISGAALIGVFLGYHHQWVISLLAGCTGFVLWGANDSVPADIVIKDMFKRSSVSVGLTEVASYTSIGIATKRGLIHLIGDARLSRVDEAEGLVPERVEGEGITLIKGGMTMTNVRVKCMDEDGIVMVMDKAGELRVLIALSSRTTVVCEGRV